MLGVGISWASRVAAIGVAACVVAALLAPSASASGRSTPAFYTDASPSTRVGQQVFDHTNLSGTSPTGTISFTLYAPGDTSCQSPVFAATVAVSGTGSDDSPRYTPSGAGTYMWVAAYSGDAKNNPASSACASPSQSVIVDRSWVGATTSLKLDAGAIQATTVLSGGYGAPTGTLTFTVTGPNDTFCSATPVYTQAVAVNGTGSYGSGRFTPTAPGSYTYKISYSGDTNNAGLGPTSCLESASIAVTPGQMGHAALTNPTDGGVKDTTKPFTWSAAPGAQMYSLWIGTSRGASDLAAAYLPGATQSYDVALLPTGKTLYARLWTLTNGSWSIQQDISFTTDGAVFTSPTDGQSDVASGPLTWTAVAQAQRYAVWLGSTRGGYDFGAVALPADTTHYDAPLPRARQIYARIWTQINGTWARYQDISFTAGQGATLSSPTDGQTGVDPGAALTWNAAGKADYYAVWVGTTPGGYDLAYGYFPAGTTSYTPTGIPRGRTLYARIWTRVAGFWYRYQDISYTTAR